MPSLEGQQRQEGHNYAPNIYEDTLWKNQSNALDYGDPIEFDYDSINFHILPIQQTTSHNQLEHRDLIDLKAKTELTKYSANSSVREKFFCKACGEECPNHNSYGGLVCASCRAFFRRSVQSNSYKTFDCRLSKNCIVTKHNRKNCKLCRFNKCLQCGMRTSWVLSEEERNRRFTKIKIKTEVSSLITKPSWELDLKLTSEEIKLLQKVGDKFHVINEQYWTKSFYTLDSETETNLLESTFGLSKLKFHSWCVMEDCFKTFFFEEVMPEFLKVSYLTTEEINQVVQGKGAMLAHLFKICFYMKTSEYPKPDLAGVKYVINDMMDCPFVKYMINILSNQHQFSESVKLSVILCKFSLENGQTPCFPTYDDIFYRGWAGNNDVETRHRETMVKIQAWPRDDKDKFDYQLFLLMTLLLIFSNDQNQTNITHILEKNQLNFVILLQRYLRSKMNLQSANQKFLQAMNILSCVEDLWEMNNRRFKQTSALALH